jgi:4-hydroxybenzoate polyprenyltransferase
LSEVALLADVASILRLHIIGVAMAAALVFSWLMTGELRPEIAVIGGVDWCLINLLNRITDLREDLANQIRGTEQVARHRRGFVAAWLVLFFGSFAVSLAAFPELTWLRAVVQLIGLGYSLALVPTPRGMKRFKDLYFLKNFMSAVLFVLTCFIYPLAVAGWASILPGGGGAIALLILFFVPFELTYEILYDMRDLEGDRLAGVPTYPVVHGVHRSRQIIDGLLAVAALVMAVGLASGLLGLREGLMLAAPGVQLAFYRPRYRRGLTTADCIWLTHLGTALLLFYVAGNQLWLAAGLPANIYLL